MTGPGASGASGASGYPTYTDNPYVGGPDEVVPDGGLSATGIADLAAKSQQDWQEELFGNLDTSLDPLSELFSIVTQTFVSIAEKIIGVFSDFVDLDKIIDVLNDILTFFYNILDRSGFLSLFQSIIDFFEQFDIEAFLQPLFDFFGWFWDGVEDGFQGFAATVNTILKPLLEWLAQLWNQFGDSVDSFLDPVIDFLNWLWTLFGDVVVEVLKPIFTWLNWFWRLFANIDGPNPEPTGPGAGILVPLFKWLDWLWEQFGDVVEAILKPIFEWLNWFWRLFANIEGPNPEPTGPGAVILVPIFKWIDWLWELFGEAVTAVLKPIFEWLNWLWRLFANIEGPNPEPTGPGAVILVPLFKWLDNIWELIGETVLLAFNDLLTWVFDLLHPESIQEFLEDIVNFFTGVLNPQRFVDLIKGILGASTALFDGLGASSIMSLITQMFSWLINFFLRTLDAGAATFNDLFNAAKEFLANIPLVGQLLGLAGGATVNGKPISTLPDLVAWFQSKVLTVDSAIPAQNLFGPIPSKLLSSIGVGNVDDSTPNQVDLNTFPAASVMQVGGRWSWDADVSRASDSGSAKVTCNSSASRMFSNKISVTEGQLLSLSAWAKWQSVTRSGSNSPIQIGLRTYNGGVLQQSFVSVAAVPTLGFQATRDWYEIENAIAWSVPPNVDEVRMSIGVDQAATGGTVWFDDIALRKTNNLAQNLVSDLPSAFSGAFDGLLGNPKGTTALPSATTDNMFSASSATRGIAGTASTRADAALVGASGAVIVANQAASGASGAVIVANQAASGASGAVIVANRAASGASGAVIVANRAASGASGAVIVANQAASGASGAVIVANQAASGASGASVAAVLADSLATLAGVANNLIVSPDFDDTDIRRYGDTNNPDAFYAASYTTEVGNTRSGSALKIVVKLSGLNNLQVWLSPLERDGSLVYYPCTPGQIYYFDMWMKAASTNGNASSMGLNMAIDTVSGSPGGTQPLQNITIAKGTWQRVSGTWTVPTALNPIDEPYKIRPQFYVQSPSLNDTYYIDRALIYR